MTYFFLPLKKYLVLNFKIIAIFNLIIILLISFLLRLNSLDYPLTNGEASRDYLISRHVAFYNEMPRRSPFNQIYNWGGSAQPYLFLSLFLHIKDDILTLSLVNICLQMLFFLILFLIAKELFSYSTALISVFLLSFSEVILNQSAYAWNPYLMQPFFYLSLLLLVYTYTRKRYLYLILGVFFLVLAETFHHSVATVFPLYLVCSLVILKLNKKRLVYYLGVLAVFFSTPLLFYLPLINYLTQQGEGSNFLFIKVYYFQSIAVYFINLISYISTITDVLFKNSINYFSPINHLLSLAVVACIALYFFLQKSLAKKIFILISFLFIFQPILFASLLTQPMLTYLFTLDFGLLILIIAEVVNLVLSQNYILSAMKIVLLILLIHLFGPINPKIDLLPKPRYNQMSIQNAVTELKKELFSIQRNQSYQKLDFFQIRRYVKEIPRQDHDAVLWAPLEKEYRTRFTKIDEKVYYYYGISSLNKEQYIFLSCDFYNSIDEQDCLKKFMSANPGYQLVKHFYRSFPFSLYEFRNLGEV